MNFVMFDFILNVRFVNFILVKFYLFLFGRNVFNQNSRGLFEIENSSIS